MLWPTTPKPRTTAHDEQPEAVDDAGTPVKPLRQRLNVWCDEQGRQVDESETDWESDQDHDELEGQDDWKFSRQRAGVWYDGQGCPVDPSQTDWVSVYSRESQVRRKELDGQDNEAEAPSASSGLLGTPVPVGASSQPPESTDQEDPSPHSTRTTSKFHRPRYPFRPAKKAPGRPVCLRLRSQRKDWNEAPILLVGEVDPNYTSSTRSITDVKQHVFVQFDRVQDRVQRHRNRKMRLAILPRTSTEQGNMVVADTFVPGEQYKDAGEAEGVAELRKEELFQAGKRSHDWAFVGHERTGTVFSSFVVGVILHPQDNPRIAPPTFTLYWEISYAKGRVWRVSQSGRFKAKLGSDGWEGRNYFD